MDYEKKLALAKEALESGSYDKETIERIFPELKQSEDERIRKELISHFVGLRDNVSKDWYGIKVNDILTWLEKQDDKDKLIKELSEYKTKYTQKVLEKHINTMSNKDNERLRKTTIAFLKDFAEQGYENAVECIDWLEKQSEKKSIWHNEDEEPQRGSLILLIMQSGTPIVAKIIEPNHTFNHGERWAYIDDLLEKQDSYYTFEIKKGHWYKCVCDYMLNNSDLMFKNGKLYYCRSDWRLGGEIDERNVKDIGVNGYKSFFRPATNQEIKDWLEKQGEQNPTKVEPKFHQGNWVVFNNKHQSIYQVEKIEDGYYILRHTHGGTFRVCVLHDESLRLWTIKDAKDGDVLNDGTTIFIFKDLLSDGSVMSYCDYDTDSGESDAFCPLSMNLMCSKITPVTKEQRETLFKAIHEAGYEWDAERKELKKIEIIPLFNVGDTIIKKHNSDIHDFGQFTITDITGGKYWYNDRIICDITEQDEWELYETDRQKPAWSKEDEIALQDALWCCKQAASIANDDNDMGNVLYAEKWLKSLKPQLQWKPSEEQMQALEYQIYSTYEGSWQYKALKELLEQLKKL